MHTAATILDAVVRHIDTTGFAAHGIHVRTRTAAPGAESTAGDVAEHHWTPDVRREIHSAAKGVCVLTTGIAADNGLVDVDEPIATSLVGTGLGTATGLALGDGVDRVTLRHLLTMTSGIDMP